jgi:enoyl-CoA hydratase
MAFDNLLLERDAGMAVVTVNRPRVLNALDTRTMDELRRAALELKRDEAIRAVVITGAGEKAFVAGADIDQLATLTPDEAKAYALAGQHVFDLLENLGKPIVAALNGFALGGGCELALACTFRIAADTARLGQPEVKLGLIPGFAGTQRLARLVGKGRALDLILTGRMIDAEEAFRIGLVHRVVPSASLMTEARSLAASLSELAPVAMRYAMEAINRGAEVSFPEASFLEATLFGLLFSTADAREGTRAFLDKRKAAFRGK